MAHRDLDELLNALLPFAQQMLAKHGEFYPFGSAMTAEGKMEMHAGYRDEEQPPSEKLIDLISAAFRQEAMAGKIRAAAICCDVRTIPPSKSEKTDAICVSAEHQNGEAADVYLPYKKDSSGDISYGEIFGCVRKRQFFAERPTDFSL